MGLSRTHTHTHEKSISCMENSKIPLKKAPSGRHTKRQALAHVELNSHDQDEGLTIHAFHDSDTLKTMTTTMTTTTTGNHANTHPVTTTNKNTMGKTQSRKNPPIVWKISCSCCNASSGCSVSRTDERLDGWIPKRIPGYKNKKKRDKFNFSDRMRSYDGSQPTQFSSTQLGC